MDDRRLIEDYLPLDDLNAIATREKLHPRRYVALVHYRPARRPITASRAAILRRNCLTTALVFVASTACSTTRRSPLSTKR